MIPEDLHALVLADAIGALDTDEQRELLTRLASLSPDMQEQVSRLYDTTLSMADGMPMIDPPARVRERLVAQIGAPSRYTASAQEAEWKESGLPGLTMRILSVDRTRGMVTMLIRGEAGATYPAHHHTGPEECYIISGTVLIDGRALGPGDFHHADADSDHGELMTPTGAEVLIVGAIADYLGE
jgi:anti-sigma factor ChrR (cupin superfamily)